MYPVGCVGLVRNHVMQSGHAMVKRTMVINFNDSDDDGDDDNSKYNVNILVSLFKKSYKYMIKCRCPPYNCVGNSN